MKYNQLGNTGMFVSEICLGAMTFNDATGRFAMMGSMDQATVTNLVGTSIEAGVNFIDTADVYSSGRSEQMLGQALRDLKTKRSDVLIASKCFGRMGPGPNDQGASRGHIFDSIDGSLKRLGVDYIDLYQIHATDILAPVEETMRALDDLVRMGKVRYVGCSNWQAWKIMKANGVAEHRGLTRFEMLQAYYSIAGRDLERDIVPLLNDQKIGLMVWSPLAGGLLSGKYDRDGKGPQGARRPSFEFPPVDKNRAFNCIDAMREVAKARDSSVARVALAWLLAKPHVTAVIIGARNEEQLVDNLGATKLALSADEMKKLDEVSALPAEYPGWMLAMQGGGRRPQPRQ
jgi:aryl-alcohol dehydrogenase-like predicted oxidoreductase